MNKYDPKVFLVFKKLAGKKFKDVLDSAIAFELLGKSPERALADALETFHLEGEVN